ncbi:MULTISPECIES: dihydroxy-acid dehydratase [unclassified Acidisoma]|uniref:dihydroxy-acid dehydratase domain-containing protein n=1 Tax=unclassified Acidisoma TaxID=2634065 RepID=UPI00131D76D2
MLVLKNIGSRGESGMPEAAYCRSQKLPRARVKDMLRICDGRISGTAFGPIGPHNTTNSSRTLPSVRLRWRRHAPQPH